MTEEQDRIGAVATGPAQVEDQIAGDGAAGGSGVPPLGRAFEDAGIAMAFVAPCAGPGGLGAILSANPAMAQFTGYPLEQLLGMAFPTLVHREDVAISEDLMHRLVSGEIESCSFEKRFEHADGHLVWGLLTVTPARTEIGEREGCLIVQLQDISERKHFVGQLEYFADHDPLTSLLNQRRFRIDVDRQLAYGRRHGGCGALIMLDLDYFKQINDQFGHAAGDEVIIAVAAVLRKGCRETDIVARLGGDEFAVLLPESSMVDAGHHAEKLLELIRSLPIEGAASGIQVAASAGLAGFCANDGQCADDVLINADLALYQAKESGRGKVEVFAHSTGLHEKVEARLLWSVRIREALTNNGFVVHAKPVIDLETDDVVYYELVIRLKAIGDILIPPSVFLYTAERFGMAVDIDEWVTAQAVALLEGLEPEQRLPLGVNISGSSLIGDRFINVVRAHLQRSGLKPELLIFELNEAVAMANMEQAKQFGRALASLGCQLALDDFGAAFGSFYYLKHLPVDILKIDGAYIRGLGMGTQLDHTDRLIIEAVVQLAKGLGTKVVASFVGNLETRKELLQMGIRYGQGAFLGPSRDVVEIPALQTQQRDHQR